MTFEQYYLQTEGIKNKLATAGLAALLPFQSLATNAPPRRPRPPTTQQQQQPLTAEEANTTDNILAATLTGEARGEGADGMRAVLNVLLNRLRYTNGDFNDLRAIALAPYQFSIWNGRNQESRTQFVNRMRGTPQWATAVQLVQQARRGAVQDNTGGATFYHTSAVNPTWRNDFRQTATIGNHIFYTHEGSNASSFIPGRRNLPRMRVAEAIDTPNNGFVDRPIGGPNLVNFSPNFKPPVGLYRGSDQIGVPTLTSMKMRAKKLRRLARKHKRSRKL